MEEAGEGDLPTGGTSPFIVWQESKDEKKSSKAAEKKEMHCGRKQDWTAALVLYS